ncbi:hypothetical protein DPMN_033300 [Dreissena polymorpha]|uniref:Choline/carnitine acyltransferase domain-containing protein n=1 Tax=Dreissena polymorpha TaxID=45954 RepID=A0A9D4RJQ1_DREPO|nr:hypothetical protein DPMN_033300 [Dreissena polymorpha]
MEPLLIRNTIPICMAQYELVFSTTRVPGEEMDQLVHYSSTESKHIILDMFDMDRKLVSPADLQKQLHWIMMDAERHLGDYSEEARSLPALTGLNRKEWATVRQTHFNGGLNQDSLATLEKALFHDISSRAQYLFHADGKSIWFDKSLTLLVQPDGRMGLNCEHSYADAPVLAHIIEINFTQE